MTSRETVLARYPSAFAWSFCDGSWKVYYLVPAIGTGIMGSGKTSIALSSTHRVEADAWDEAAARIAERDGQ